MPYRTRTLLERPPGLDVAELEGVLEGRELAGGVLGLGDELVGDVAVVLGLGDGPHQRGPVEELGVVEVLAAWVAAGVEVADGVDVVLDVVGGEAFDQSLRCLNWDGRLLVVGFASGIIPKAPANLPLLNNASIIGVLYGPWIDRFPQEALELNTKLMGWLADRKIKPHIHKTFPLEQAGKAMMELINRKAIGKVMLKVR